MNPEDLSYLLIKRKEREGKVRRENNDAEFLQAVPKEYKQNNTFLEVCKSAW
jgi:hypothetical protein